MKHNKAWYIKAHNIMAGSALCATLLGLILICGLLEVL